MDYQEALNQSQIWAARGYDPETNESVVSVAFYGGVDGEQLMWLEGWGGDWKKEWEPVPEDKLHMLEGLDFYPVGPKPADQINDEIVSALSEIADEYAYEEEEGDDYFRPLGAA